MPRIRGRIIRPSNLAERRVLKSIGVDILRVPRGQNPFVAMRLLKRLASNASSDVLGLKKMRELDRERRPNLPIPKPCTTTGSEPANAPAA